MNPQDKDAHGEYTPEYIARNVGRDMNKLIEITDKLAQVRAKSATAKGIEKEAFASFERELYRQQIAILRVYPGTGLGHS